ncbi:hypothetical protein CS0771_15060 [Catellatospora sp. IY07-71]|uniref:hypothetical protein n=1 Tax=Catellatospora sp. IY07-71 TaxID=2728827 RepID=UPI001BB433DB|nr:hypothetical protein [Catellatospora sp. IY07-71]BCJ71962.1 hypothetical protein CS0771_15060 [Catellatospora sp. IY07-71]
MTVDPDHSFEDAALVLDQALAGDGSAVAGTLDKVVQRDGSTGAYNVAWCLAGELAGDGVRAGAWALDFPGIEEAAYDARWVARFVSAYVNHDEPTGEALIGAALADGQLNRCLLTLAGSTVATKRRREG